MIRLRGPQEKKRNRLTLLQWYQKSRLTGKDLKRVKEGSQGLKNASEALLNHPNDFTVYTMASSF